MPSQEKLIKQGIRYTDSLFNEISKRIEQGVLSTDTLEAFLDKYHKAYPDNGNPLVTLGYDKEMIKLILSETNNHKFTRPAQKELVRVTIENRVGDNIVDVGDEIRDSVRDIVKEGYNNRLSQDEIAENISSKVTGIKNRRARAIARTEIARAATISDYIINKEMGATHFYVECRNTACPVCKEAWHNKWTPENDSSFNPSDTSAGGKGWIGDKTYSMSDTKMLPPLHPNSYHKDTQVFTEHGWKYIAELTGDEKLLSLNPDDDSLEFIKPVRLFKHKEPQLVHMHNKWFDVCVTPDHDCFVHKRRDGGKKGRYFEPQFRKPSDLNSECHFVRCIDTDRESPEAININGLEFEPSDFAFFMAWYISEGSVLHDVEKAQKRRYPVFIAQQLIENREIIQPVLEKMCDYLGLKMNITKNSFVIYSKELYDYLLPLGYSNEKYIPSEVFTLNKECLNVFLDNYVRGDGHERTHGRYNSVERSVFTSSVRLRDDLSYLILLCGYCPSISLHSHKGTVVEHRNGTYTQNYDIYGIRINSSKYASYSGLTVDRVDYDDYTYCVELPKWHTLWVMRNGKTSWNGNCRCVPYFITENEAPKDAVIVEPTTRETTTQSALSDTNDFDQERYNQLKTPEEVADFFGLEYNPNGLEFKHIKGKTIEFYDPEHECTIRIFTDKNNKIGSLDLNNSGNGKLDLKEVIKAYNDAPRNYKNATNEIEFMKGNPLSTHMGECCGQHIVLFESAFEQHGQELSNRSLGTYGELDAINTTLWHEMTHAFENANRNLNEEFLNPQILYQRFKKEWENAKREDYKYQQSHGIKQQDSSLYGEDMDTEDLAEFGAMVVSKMNNKDYIMGNNYSIKVPCEARASGCRKRQSNFQALEVNPNRAKLMEKWINDPSLGSLNASRQERKERLKLYKKNGMI